MAKRSIISKFIVNRDQDKCIQCNACVRMCSNDANYIDKETGRVLSNNELCVGCHFCENICPTNAIKIEKNQSKIENSDYWTNDVINNIHKQATTGAILLTSMGNSYLKKVYFDHILLNAAQVTNPSIDPLREPMELRHYIGKRPNKYTGDNSLPNKMLKLNVPILFSAMSFGSISLNASKSLAAAARDLGILFNTGEGGLHEEIAPFKNNMIVQVASGRFGVTKEYLQSGVAIEIKVGQGAKPGIGGHLPGEKVSEEISKTRHIPKGSDAISPAPHHDIYSIEDLKQLIDTLKEATDHKKPVGVKIAAVHNVAPIASGIVRAGADFVTIDGIRGGTGAAPEVIRDHVGIPIEVAISAVDSRLRHEGIRNQASILAAGGIRNSADVIKAVALGADAVYIGSAALIALGCTQCHTCYTGRCNWGIATQNPFLTKRLNPKIGIRNLKNLIRGWSLEIKDMMGGMGINAIESLRGNREQLRGIDLSEQELALLGIKHAGEISL